MKNLGFYFGAFPTAGWGVSEIVNWNPFTLSFWATITGLLIYTFLGGLIGLAIHSHAKKIIQKKWHGTGQIHSKD